jgi:uncharacterized membrane protein YvlD (DUF360 family)
MADKQNPDTKPGRGRPGQRRFPGLVFMLHSNYAVHMTLSFLLNVLAAAVVIGFSEAIKQPLIAFTLLGFLFAMGLLTLLENFVKLLLYTFLTKLMLMSMGMVALMVQVILLYVTDLVLPVGFAFESAESILMFAVIFSVLRLFMSIRVRRFMKTAPVIVIRRR